MVGDPITNGRVGAGTMTGQITEIVFAAAGTLLILAGCVVCLVFGLDLGGLMSSPLHAIGLSGAGHYLGTTAGSALIGWGTILLVSRRLSTVARQAIALGTGTGFLALCTLRLWAALGHDTALQPLLALLLAEAVLYLVAAILFFEIGVSVLGRLVQVWWSLAATPLWVQVWVWLFLLPVNMAAIALYAMTAHPLAGWTALGFAFVVLTNVPLTVYERGISRLTSLPHLIPWVPLQVYCGYWIFIRSEDLGAMPEIHAFAWAYFCVIGISNVFDAYDTVRWFRGERAVHGAVAQA